MNPLLYAVYERSPIFLQNAMVSLYGLRLLRERLDSDFEDKLAWLAETDHWPPEQHRAFQEERLRDVVEHDYEHVPFYRRRMEERGLRPEDLRTIEDLQKLPVLRRAEVHEHFDEMLSRAARRRELVLGHTSGTTGSPLEFYWDHNVCVWNNLLEYHYRSWAGARFGDVTATLLGNVIVPLHQQKPPFWRTCKPWKRIFFSSFHLEPRHLPSYVAALRELGSVWLEAYPSTAYVLAQHLEERGETLPLAGVLLSSETLTRAVRERIEQRFATRAWDSYSMSERVIFSGECEEHAGQHLFPQLGIVEVLNEQDEPLPPGRVGRLVATGLQNLAMPFLRYDTGDVGGYDPEPCGCGRTYPKMFPITTKAEDIVVTPEGRFISSSVLTHPFKPMVNIEKSQIIQESLDRLVVRIVRRSTYGDRDSEILLAGLRQRLGPTIDIQLEFVEDIPRTPAGKYRWVISRVPLRLGTATETNLFWEDQDVQRTS